MAHKKLPDWAPLDLIAEYERYRKLLDGDPEAAKNGDPKDPRIVQSRAIVYESLLSSEVMAAVWPRLAKRKSRLDEIAPTRKPRSAIDYAMAVWSALCARSSWEQLTPRERKSAVQSFAIEARKLADMAQKFGIGQNILELFRDDEMSELKWFLRDHGYGGEIGAKNITFGESPNRPVVRYLLVEKKPSMSNLLNRIADEVEAAPPYASSVLAKPGAKNSNVVHFVRSLSRYTVRQYGTPLHEIIADTTSVFYTDPMPTKESVRNILKGFV